MHTWIEILWLAINIRGLFANLTRVLVTTFCILVLISFQFVRDRGGHFE
jgi:hypothetical protein